MSQLISELRQCKLIESFEEEVLLSLARTTALVSHEVELRLREHGISETQYGVLRILRCAGTDGLMQHEVGHRLLTLVPDVPRILTRMERACLIYRERDPLDRRVMRVRLAPAGKNLVDGLDGTIRELHQKLFAGMDEREMRCLCGLLEQVRGGAGAR